MVLDPSIALRALNPGDLQKMNDQHNYAQSQMSLNSQRQKLGNLEVLKAQNDAIIQRLAVTNNQESWSKGLEWAKQNGIDTNGLPQQYDPQLKDQLLMSSLSAAERIQLSLQQSALGARESDRAYQRMQDDRAYDLKVRELDAKMGEDRVGPLGSGPISQRNNNPGNLRSRSGGFQSFSSPEEGLQALKSDLTAKVSGNSPAMKANYGEGYTPTLERLLTTYAPPTENNTKAYIDFVSKKSGIDPKQPLTTADVDKIVPYITEMEGGKGARAYFENSTGNQGFAMEAPQTNVVRGPNGEQGQLLFKGRNQTPFTEGLEKGFQWAEDGNGNRFAARIPGTDTGAQGAIVTAQDTLGILDQIVKTDPKTGKDILHPGLESSVGLKGLSGGLLGGWVVPGTESANFNALLDQLQGKQFLEAYQYLRGSGSISQIEGEKAGNAMARMQKSQTEASFIKAAKEFKGILERGIERQKRMSNLPIRQKEQSQSNVIDFNDLTD
jgi:hypothetical protein